MKFLLINDDRINRFLIARATFDGETLTLNIHGAGQHTYQGGSAAAAWESLMEDARDEPRVRNATPHVEA